MLRLAPLLLLFFFQDAVFEDPEYKGWAACKPGSWVKHKDEGQGMIMEWTEKLKSVNENEAVLETILVTTFKGKVTKDDKPGERKVKAKEKVPRLPQVVKEGEEEIAVAGKKLACRWTVYEREEGGKKISIKTWTSDQIPGGTARMEITSGGASVMKRTVLAWEKQ
jgi:hypothetical protein